MFSSIQGKRQKSTNIPQSTCQSTNIPQSTCQSTNILNSTVSRLILELDYQSTNNRTRLVSRFRLQVDYQSTIDVHSQSTQSTLAKSTVNTITGYRRIFGFEDISDFGDCFDFKLFSRGTVEAKSFLAGSPTFQTTEIEVFQLTCSLNKIKQN